MRIPKKGTKRYSEIVSYGCRGYIRGLDYFRCYNKYTWGCGKCPFHIEKINKLAKKLGLKEATK